MKRCLTLLICCFVSIQIVGMQIVENFFNEISIESFSSFQKYIHQVFPRDVPEKFHAYALLGILQNEKNIQAADDKIKFLINEKKVNTNSCLDFEETAQPLLSLVTASVLTDKAPIRTFYLLLNNGANPLFYGDESSKNHALRIAIALHCEGKSKENDPLCKDVSRDIIESLYQFKNPNEAYDVKAEMKQFKTFLLQCSQNNAISS